MHNIYALASILAKNLMPGYKSKLNFLIAILRWITTNYLKPSWFPSHNVANFYRIFCKLNWKKG